MYDNSRVNDIGAKLGAFLREPISDKTLRSQIVGIESLRLELLEVRCDWEQLLAEKKSQYLHPKDKDLTELDRRVGLNASLASIQRDCDFLEGLDKLVDSRLGILTALLHTAPSVV